MSRCDPVHWLCTNVRHLLKRVEVLEDVVSSFSTFQGDKHVLMMKSHANRLSCLETILGDSFKTLFQEGSNSDACVVQSDVAQFGDHLVAKSQVSHFDAGPAPGLSVQSDVPQIDGYHGCHCCFGVACDSIVPSGFQL